MSKARISKWRVLVALMFAFILAYIAFVLWRALVPAEWEFSIEAETEVAEINLRPQARTQWQVDGVVLCARGGLELADEFQMSPSMSPCGSRAWRAYHVPAPEHILISLCWTALPAKHRVVRQLPLQSQPASHVGANVGCSW